MSKHARENKGNLVQFPPQRIINHRRCSVLWKYICSTHCSLQDFTSTANRTYPSSCCSPEEQTYKRPLTSPVVFRPDDISAMNSLSAAQQKNNFSEMTDLTFSHVLSESKEEIRTVTACRAVYPQVSIFYLTLSL